MQSIFRKVIKQFEITIKPIINLLNYFQTAIKI
jgi:hypothetical protein